MASPDDSAIDDQWTPLFHASQEGNLDAVTSLLKSGVNHLFVDSSGGTALHVAISNGRVDVVQKLLDYPAISGTKTPPSNPRTLSYREAVEIAMGKRNKATTTPLELAAEVNNDAIFSILLNKLERPGHYDQTIHFNGLWARRAFSQRRSRNRYWDLMRTELVCFHTRQIYLTNTERETREKLLHYAIMDHKFHVFVMLLRQGVDPNAYFQNTKKTPMHTAATFCEDPCYVEALVKQGARLTWADEHKRTPLELAIINGYGTVAMALLEAGASPDPATPNSKCSPLFAACGWAAPGSDMPLRVVHKLVGNGADVNVANHRGETALHMAASVCALDVFKELISFGSDITVVDQRGGTVYSHLVESPERDPSSIEDFLRYVTKLFPVDRVSHPGNIHPLRSALNYTSTPISMVEPFTQVGFTLDRSPEPAVIMATLERAMRRLWFSTVVLLLESFADIIPADLPNTFMTSLLYDLPSGPTLTLESGKMDRIISIVTLLFLAGLGTKVHFTHALFVLVEGNYRFSELEAIVEVLLRCGADRYSGTVYDVIARAAMYNKPAILTLLLRDRPEPGTPNYWLDSFSVIRQSVPDDVTAVFTCLKGAGLLETPHGLSTGEPLLKAIERADVETLSKILACGVNTERQDEFGWRPLHHAILKGHGPSIDALLEYDAGSVNATTHKWENDYSKPTLLYRHDRWTGRPLHLAAMFGDLPTVQKLLALGADVNASTGDPSPANPGHGPSALHMALDTGLLYGRRRKALDPEYLAIARLLVEHGADTSNVANHLKPQDVLMFRGFESLWDALKAGAGIPTTETKADDGPSESQPI